MDLCALGYTEHFIGKHKTLQTHSTALCTQLLIDRQNSQNLNSPYNFSLAVQLTHMSLPYLETRSTSHKNNNYGGRAKSINLAHNSPKN